MIKNLFYFFFSKISDCIALLNCKVPEKIFGQIVSLTDYEFWKALLQSPVRDNAEL